MCGICGIYNLPEEGNDINTMLNAIEHRGPDGKKIKLTTLGGAGFCWLNIFGPDKLSQPFYDEIENILIVFNGEIYNFEELRMSINTEIESEVELIRVLFIKYDAKLFSMLEGMFSIAIFSSDCVYLARDTFGIKPLFYFTENCSVYFASELKALTRVYKKELKINRDVMAEVSVFGFIHSLEETMIENINQVAPGTYIKFKKDGNFEKHSFVQIKKSFDSLDNINVEEQLQELEQLFLNAAKKYMNHSKSNHAVYLSGGLDSSIIAYNLAMVNKIDSFTLYDEDSSQDRFFANKLSNQIDNIEHHEYKVDLGDTLNFLKHYLYHYECIVTDGLFNVLGSVAFHVLSYKISKTFKIAYCGEGADELFGGYKWLHTHPLGTADRIRLKAASVNKGKTKINHYINEIFPDDDSKKEQFRLSIFDLLIGPGLTNCHLWSVDRSSSSFSFEARPFYLDKAIAEFALKIPVEYKVSFEGETKLLLKGIANRLPHPIFIDISQRKKIGMPSALNLTLPLLNKYIEDNKILSKESPHREFESYFHTPIEKALFDLFYEIFIINKGKNAGFELKK